ncbi:hypothetical protein PoB_003902500 [Plakobranchus ocellatus]|uniref:Uncharacterized protein n=1 Tax=Plakobranchus ocellatus TaxID=259542 RepID=A0AAV4AVX1_9GAST|nr:hypothetical protein PoB_003902500 [Plakobranchus ocellatus]
MVEQSVCFKTPKLFCVGWGGTGTCKDNCLDGGTGKASTTNLKHHEHTASAQVKFSREVGALIQVFEEMGNPFMEESEDLLVLDSRDIADPAIVQTVRSREDRARPV